MTGKRGRRGGLSVDADLELAGLGTPAERGGKRGKRGERARPVSEPAEAGAARPGPEDMPEPETVEAAAFAIPDDAVVRRTKDGWRVGSDDFSDLTCAMVLADLLAAEAGIAEERPRKPALDSAASGETGKLRATVGQLEHALLTRIRVEQAIGVLAERHRIKPRQAFEQLREAARSRGRRVIDIAGDVVASATNPLLQLPDELSRPRSGPRRPPRQSFGAQ
jgi:hypothetical protein